GRRRAGGFGLPGMPPAPRPPTQSPAGRLLRRLRHAGDVSRAVPTDAIACRLTSYSGFGMPADCPGTVCGDLTGAAPWPYLGRVLPRLFNIPYPDPTRTS